MVKLYFVDAVASYTCSRLAKIKGWIDANNPGDPLIPFSVSLEERLAPLEGQERKDEEEKAEAQSSLPKIITAGYASLDLIRYFTCGPDEVRAWTIRNGTKAPQAAGVIQLVKPSVEKCQTLTPLH
jgi:obg-like ATPase 1